MMMLSHSIPKLHSTIYKSAEKNNILLSKHFISRQVYMHFAYKKIIIKGDHMTRVCVINGLKASIFDPEHLKDC